MKKSKRSFVPVAGLMVAGLVGSAYALCYAKVTYTCAMTSDLVGNIDLWCDQFREVRAKNNWLYNNHANQLQPGQSGFSDTQVSWGTACSGAAVYIDCNSVLQTIANFQSSFRTYDPINSSTPECTD